MIRRIKVLIVDDSAVVRQVLADGIGRDPGITVVGTAPDAYVARDKIVALEPDVVTLDVEMPRMDGISFLRTLMQHHPMPVVMVSTLTLAGADTTIKALELGAVDFVAKPNLGEQARLPELVRELIEKIKVAADARVRRRDDAATGRRGEGASPASPCHPISASGATSAMLKTTHQVIAIGASTGGVEALKSVLTALPSDMPGIMIVQHMPVKFTAAFAERLNNECRLRVKEATDGDGVAPGLVLIAPGNRHMTLSRSGAQYRVALNDDPQVHYQRPAADVLFHSVARYAGSNALGVVLTGMGADGAAGLLAMRQAGARTVAQDEASCVVFGMPKEAIKLGAAERVLPLDSIPAALMQLTRET